MEKKLTPEELEAKIAQLEKANADKEAQLKAQEEMINQERAQNDQLNQELLQKLEEVSLQKDAEAPVVSHGKEKFRVVVPKFQLGKEHYTAKDVTSNSELLKKLVAVKSGVLEKVETPTN